MSMLSRDAILSELETSKKLLEVWEKRIEETGLPELNYISSPAETERFYANFYSEMTLVSRKLDTIGRISVDRIE